MRPLSTNSTFGSISIPGNSSAKASHSVQCVVARSPSSSPAAASRKAEVHRLTMRVSGRIAFSTAVTSSGSVPVASSWGVGSWVAITTVSAVSSSDSSCSTTSRKSSRVRTGRPPIEQVPTEYRRLPSEARASLKTRAGMPRSSGRTPSRARTAIRCVMAGMVRQVSLRPLTHARTDTAGWIVPGPPRRTTPTTNRSTTR